MTPLNKSLVFYLTYPAEMNHLYQKPEYEGETPDLTGLGDAEHVRDMARVVGAAAYQEALDFLEDCGKKIEAYFASMGTVTFSNRSSRSRIRRNWEWYVKVWVTSAREWFYCGVNIDDGKGIIIPWLWRRGGRAWEDRVMKRLGARAHSQAGGGVVWDSGTVALARIPFFAGNQPGGDVDRDVLVAKVVGAFTVIEAADVEAISRNFGEEDGSSEPDEADIETE